jgi:uncharacterized membrane protein YeiH
MFFWIVSFLDWLGIIVFATTGALVASRKQMDIVGFALLATATGVGGGTLRDLILGLAPVFWVRSPAYLFVCVAVACIVFFTAHLIRSRYRTLLWLDAVGMAVFAVAGTEISISANANPSIAVAMGVTTATFGGIIRDLLGGESPIILRREIYVTAALLGASIYSSLVFINTPQPVSFCAGFISAFSLRGTAILFGWSLPRYRPRIGRSFEE